MSDNECLQNTVMGVAHDGMMVLELGVAMGISTRAIADVVKEYKGNLVAIDNWPNEEMYCQFLMDCHSYKNVISPHRINLFTIDTLFLDGQFDLIHFDACYTWPDVKLMIQRYLPKLKHGGVVCGHGAEFYWGALSNNVKELLKIYHNKVTIPILPDGEVAQAVLISQTPDIPFQVHANLSRALYEIFHDDYKICGEHTYWSRTME